MLLRTWFARWVIVSVAAASVCGASACKSRSGDRPPPGSGAPTSSGAASALAPADSLGTIPGLPEVVREIRDAGPLATGIPVTQAALEAELNPDHWPAYSGPTGAVEGIVRMRGDEPTKLNATIPFECGDAYGTYGTLFREGAGRTVADVLVAVTGYQAYLPPESESVPVAIAGCAYDRRTIAVMFGQHLAVSNTDRRLSFIPTLLGAELPAQLVALPRGDVVRLYPKAIGHYALTDGMNRTWMYADVFVVRYPTLAVTGIDGAFRIARVPPGKLKVSAYLPALDGALHPDTGGVGTGGTPTVEQEIEVKAGETVHLDLTLTYKRPKAKPKPTSSAPPAPDIR